MKQVWMLLLVLLTKPDMHFAQGALPVREWRAATDLPFILYISGDGGQNDFSTDFCKALHTAGYAIASVDARSYFWKKKTPEVAATEISNYLRLQLANRPGKSFILIGYSFGADVLPFIASRVPPDLKVHLQSLLLLSPSGSTDFEVHLSDMMGGNKRRSMLVAGELNRITGPRKILLFGASEKNFH
ncbi:virulence factor family protein [Chitinophaga sedimenti]|uniref:AcvB/VirJ family lysyl-phosphatidylglycerol hydrolase n=1 Tax=Chitinophaga sedimenti TaxID=2033606 RepID=UPI00200515FA|nr:AcvB/VirJ family lysyl-phosphatidylglycerol hydrolase [Chitinophaga sedimenti]MCK7558422.1 virulence factor family protein [Chitinophaga sedimenti]